MKRCLALLILWKPLVHLLLHSVLRSRCTLNEWQRDTGFSKYYTGVLRSSGISKMATNLQFRVGLLCTFDTKNNHRILPIFPANIMRSCLKKQACIYWKQLSLSCHALPFCIFFTMSSVRERRFMPGFNRLCCFHTVNSSLTAASFSFIAFEHEGVWGQVLSLEKPIFEVQTFNSVLTFSTTSNVQIALLVSLS